MEQQFTIFFSWQSDVKSNRYVIRDAINAACEAIHAEYGYTFKYKESTWGEEGSIDIPSAVLKNIENCDIFVADITPIAFARDKALPNPNVLTELGYAMRCHGMERIIITTGKGDYKDYQLPFDINHFRHGKFNPETKKYDLKDEILASVNYILDNGKFQYLRFFNEFHLKQNLDTKKYLPNVFLEDDELKENLRYFLDPFFFYPKFYHETATLNFDYYNQKSRLKDLPLFEYSLQSIQGDTKDLDFVKLRHTVDQMSSYLQSKKGELNEDYTLGYFAVKKIKYQIESAQYFTSNICLLTAKAGQGKTNVVCDLVDHVLIPHYIPFAYINGYEIDDNNVGNSLARMIYPEQNYSIGELLGYVERFCVQQRKYFVLIIDGLNENPNPGVFASNLQNLLNILLQKEFIKVILTCRTEYYNLHYPNLLTSFDRKIIIKDIYHLLRGSQENILIENYCEYFNIHASFSSEVKTQLGKNLLLMRIFSEAYENQTLGLVSHLQKEQLFSAYYNKMQSSVVAQFRQDGYEISSSDIAFFIKTIVRLMIEHDSFMNVKMDEILPVLNSDQRRIIHRFIDSNIIVRKDLSSEVFGSEVVNFTYDEFRDFLIAHYLIDVIAAESFERFKELVEKYTAEKHTLREGLIGFLFLYSKDSNKSEIVDYIRTQSWYEAAFLRYIWDVREDQISDTDIADMRRYLRENMDIASMLVYGDRWNEKIHKLSIRILLDMLESFENAELATYVDAAWPNKRTWERKNSDRDHLFVQTQKVLDDMDENSEMHAVFEHLLYIAPFDIDASRIYRQYYCRFMPKDQVGHVYGKTKSVKLKSFIMTL